MRDPLERQSPRVHAVGEENRQRGLDPGNAAAWYTQFRVRADVGTARLTAYDVTNGADIASVDWTQRGWGVVDTSGVLPHQSGTYRMFFAATQFGTVEPQLMVVANGISTRNDRKGTTAKERPQRRPGLARCE